MKGPEMAFRYDYLCLAPPNGTFAYIRVEGHALDPESPSGPLLESLLAPSMKQEITLEEGNLVPGNPHGIPAQALCCDGTTFTSHAEDVGLGIMTRELLRLETGNDQVLWGLREYIKKTP